MKKNREFDAGYTCVLKIMRIMRLSVFFVILFVVQTWATSLYSQQTRLTLNMNNVKVLDVLNEIEKGSEFYFFFTEKLVDVNRSVNINVKNVKIEDILQNLFQNSDITYKVIDRQIILTKKLSEESSFVEDGKNISGKVTDSSGSSLPGVSVVIKGTTTGTITDANGNYSISNVPENATLQFSFVGMKGQEVAVVGKKTVNVKMEEETIGIEEVVAVGYGTLRKRDLTGSIASVKGNFIQKQPVLSIISGLQGAIPGVDIVQDGGAPGTTPTITIRGRRSMQASNEPLYVVDGVPLANGISTINMQDVESVEVLKDASSTAIYGARGANGVILVTTKRGGKESKPQITVNTYYGLTEPIVLPEIMNGDQFAEMKRESHRAYGGYDDKNPVASDAKIFEPVELYSLSNNISYDYPSMILEKGARSDNQIQLSGGTEKTQYVISMGYYNEKGLVKTQNYNRYTLRINLDQEVNKYIKMGTSTLLARSDRDDGNNPLDDALKSNPLGNPFDTEGNLLTYPVAGASSSLINPLYYLQEGNEVGNSKSNRILTSAYLNINFNKSLFYKLNFGIDLIDSRDGSYASNKYSTSQLPTSSVANSEKIAYTLDNILTYNKEFNIKHKLNLTLLQSLENTVSESYNASVRDLPYYSLWYDMGSTATMNRITSGYSKYSLMSFMGRAHYSFRDKYLLTLSARYDGSSRLAPGNKWDMFPSGALAWRLSEESFVKKIKAISNLKFRVSYGVVGNTNINPYQTQGTLGKTDYAWNDTPAIGYGINNIPNNTLSWEKTATLDVGLDFGFFEERINGVIDYYQSNTKDILMRRSLPITSGYDNILQNVGRTRNTGLEVALNFKVIENLNDGLNLDVGLNFAKNKEEIIELYGDTQNDLGNNWFIGEPMSIIRDYKKIGIWQTEEAAEALAYGREPGQIKLLDTNDDKKIDSEDLLILGYPIPKWTGGAYLNLTYKGFDLSAQAFTRQRIMIISDFHRSYNLLNGKYNNIVVDYWTPNNPTNDYPRPNYKYENPLGVSTLRYFDGSFIKIRNIILGYTFNKSVINRIGLTDLRVYTNISNPFLISKFKNFDPEKPSGSVGVNEPSTRMFQIGLNVKF